MCSIPWKAKSLVTHFGRFSLKFKKQTCTHSVFRHSTVQMPVVKKKNHLSTSQSPYIFFTNYKPEMSPDNGALTLMRAWTSLNLGWSLSPTSCSSTASLVVTVAPIWRNRWNRHQYCSETLNNSLTQWTVSPIITPIWQNRWQRHQRCSKTLDNNST